MKNTLPDLLPPWLPWLARLLALLVGPASKTLGRLLRQAASRWLPVVLLVALSGCSGNPAVAGWFTRGPDPKTEAANRALERAATIAAEAAAVQAQDHQKFLEAVTALSNERTHLAAQLTSLGKLAAKDAAWAAAIETAGPVLIAVAVLAVGGVALWLVTRTSEHDAQLACVLVEEIVGGTGGLRHDQDHPRFRSGHSSPDSRPRTLLGRGSALAAVRQRHEHDHDQYPEPSPETQEGDLPF